MEYCRQATFARDALTVSRAPARAKGIERQVLLAVREAATRIVTKLNELGAKADYAHEDIRLLDGFAVAISAVECLASAATCPRAEAKRIIAEFNDKAGNASFGDTDERALREFHERKAKPK